MKAIVAFIVLVVVGSVAVMHQKGLFDPNKPYLSKTGGLVYVRYHERIYTASYDKVGKRYFESMEDQRVVGRCKPRIDVGEVYTLDFSCDPKEKDGRYPQMHKRLEELPQPVIDDFQVFRSLADDYYHATH